MRFAEVTKEVAGQLSNQLNEASERYQVPQRLRAAGDTARRGAEHAYRYALEHPRTSAAAGIVLAAAIVGGVLWYLFGDSRRPVERRRKGTRVRAVTEKRKRRTHATA
jgi:hypothetical protein